MPLYKYTSPRNARYIGGRTLRFSPPSEFNDPFDCVPDLSALDEMPEYNALRARVRKEVERRTKTNVQAARLEALIWRNFTGPELRSGYLQKLLDDRKNFRVLCLSECRPTSAAAALMLGHYCENHRGFVYEFDERHPWFVAHREQHNRLRCIALVKYRAKRATLAGDKKRALFLKSTPWKYEKEVRLLRVVLNGANELQGVGRDMAQYPAAMLRSITLGCESSKRTLGLVRRQLNGNAQFAHVKLFLLKRSFDHFRFVAEELAR